MARGQGGAVGADEQDARVLAERLSESRPHALTEIALDLRLRGDAVVTCAELEKRFAGVGRAMKFNMAERSRAYGLEGALDQLCVKRRGTFVTEEGDQAGLDRARLRRLGENYDGGAVMNGHSARR